MLGVGATQFWNLNIRTGQIPNSHNISTRSGKSSTLVMFNESAIGQHLFNNPICTKNYSDEKCTILSFGHSSFNLSALEKPFTPNHASQIYGAKNSLYTN